MKHNIETVWRKKMQFETEIGHHNIIVDAEENVGGENKGPAPKPLMLSALSGCTAMDVASLLKKMRAEVTDFTVKVEAELTDEHPKYYKKVHVEYIFYAKEFKKDKIEKSVDLSVNRYCGVYEMFRQFSEVTHHITYVILE